MASLLGCSSVKLYQPFKRWFGLTLFSFHEKTFRDRGSGLQDYLGYTCNKLATKPSQNKMFSCLTWVLFQKVNVINNFLKLIIRNIFIRVAKLLFDAKSNSKKPPIPSSPFRSQNLYVYLVIKIDLVLIQSNFNDKTTNKPQTFPSGINTIRCDSVKQ